MAKGEENRPPRHPVNGGKRSSGTIISWKGSMGWIKPNAPIDHPEAELHTGKVFLHRSDLNAVVGKHDDLRGARVNFQVYADGSGLGAQQCKISSFESGAEVPAVQKSAKRLVVGKFARSLGKSSGKGAARTAPAPWVKGGKGAADGGKGVVKGKGKVKGGVKGKGKGKDKGKGKGKNKGPKEQPPRKRIGGRMLGKILRFPGKFGWIEALEIIEHPAAQKKNGEVFIYIDDVLGGKRPRDGDTVDFLPYADRTGLGAEKCRILERADGNEEGEELDDLDEAEEAAALEAANAKDDAEEEAPAEDEPAEDAAMEEAEEAAEEAPAEEAEEADAAKAEKKKPEGKGKAKAGGKGKADDRGKAKGKGKDAEAADRGKAKGKGKSAEADDRGKAKGKGQAVETGKEGGKGKSKAQAAKGKPFDAFAVRKTIEKKPVFQQVSFGQEKQGKAGAKGAAGKGFAADKGKGSTGSMVKPKVVPVVGGKAQAKGGKAAPVVFTSLKVAQPGSGKSSKGSSKGVSAVGARSGPRKGLPENWEEHYSPEHKMPYFWNRKTKESKWVRPVA